MTPEEHIAVAEEYLEIKVRGAEYLVAYTNAALAHIELAQWKESHGTQS